MLDLPRLTPRGLARPLVLAVALVPLACSAILGLDDFTQQNDAASSGTGAAGSGGAGASGNAGGAGGSGASGGSGGTAGGGVSYSCDQGNEFVIFSAAELDNSEIQGEDIHILSDVMDMRAHVAVSTQKRQVFARTVRQEDVLGTVVKYPDMPDTLSDLRVRGAYFDGERAKFVLRHDSDAAELEINASPDLGPNPPPMLTIYPKPAGCTSVDDVFIGASADPRFAAECVAGNNRHLYIGRPGNPAIEIDLQGSAGDKAYDLVDYARAGTVNLVVVGDSDFSDAATMLLRFGPDLAALSTTYPIVPDPSMATFAFGTVPIQSADGFLLFTASLKPSTLATDPQGTLRSGVVKFPDLPKLGSMPTTYLKHVETFDDTDELTKWSRPARFGSFYVAAGPTTFDPVADDAVHFFLWHESGTPLVFSHEITTAPEGVSYKAAAAAPLTPVAALVTWVESQGAVSTVKGRLVACEER